MVSVIVLVSNRCFGLAVTGGAGFGATVDFAGGEQTLPTQRSAASAERGMLEN